MNKLPYDITSADSILEYAKKLSGKSLSQVVSLSGFVENLKNKGDLGAMVERHYFNHVPPHDHEPDFAEAGVELKTTGVVKNSMGVFRAKERLVLSMINYMSLVNETWSDNSLMHKCKRMLLLFYKYESEKAIYDRTFVYNPLIWEFPEPDLKIIEADWKFIQNKIIDGKAHELSEGDTFYLGACRKGSGGISEVLKTQPFSDIKAKSRAFSLKPSYINTILDSTAIESDIFENALSVSEGLEKATQDKFIRYIGMPVNEIGKYFNLSKKGKNDKGYYRQLTLKILGAKGTSIPEFDKAGIELKTIRLQKNGMPKESMSFPTFKYMDIVNEEWEDSIFFNKLEQKFFFVIFKYDKDDTLRLHKAMYWNMPFKDREEAKRVWEKTKMQVANHKAQYLPKSAESNVAHVRPHGKNKLDTLPTPEGNLLPKKCFWLNSSYIANQVS
jgi:DNA mismatch repair endonuclease MutH